MSTDTSPPPQTDLRQRVKQRVDGLSEERLKVADDFLAYLEERDGAEATEELLRIPGFLGELEKARQEIGAGQLTPVDQLARK
jgi:hypothetical protein